MARTQNRWATAGTVCHRSVGPGRWEKTGGRHRRPGPPPVTSPVCHDPNRRQCLQAAQTPQLKGTVPTKAALASHASHQFSGPQATHTPAPLSAGLGDPGPLRFGHSMGRLSEHKLIISFITEDTCQDQPHGRHRGGPRDAPKAVSPASPTGRSAWARPTPGRSSELWGSASWGSLLGPD